MAESRWEVPQEGSLASVTHRSLGGRIADKRGVVESVSRVPDGVVVAIDGFEAKFDPESEDYGKFNIAGRVLELYRVEEVVPRSQVRRPGVSPGDTVKVMMGSNAYRVEAVGDGMVELEDGRTVPVTHITAFDEDVDDYDPFDLIPGPIGDIFGGGR